MKKIILIFIVLSIGLMAAAQTVTENFLKKIPALPRDSCNVTMAGAKSFTSQVSTLIDEAENEISKMHQQENQSGKINEEAAKEAALKQMQQQYGMSQEDVEKMKNAKNLSAAEKQAMANKMMQQQTNMSMDEVKNLSKMSDAGKQAYAEAYATEAMATGQTGQNNQANADRGKKTNELLFEQQAIMGRLNASSQKIANLYSAIESDPERQQMLKRMEIWSSKWVSMGGVDYGQGKQMDSLANLIRKEQIKYCDNFTPRYRSALRQHLSVIKASMPDYKRIVDITSALTEAQTGVPSPSQGSDMTGMQAVKEYLNKLIDAYKYKLYYPEEDPYK